MENKTLVALNFGQVARVDQHDHVDGVEQQRLRHDVLVGERLGNVLFYMRAALEVVGICQQHHLAVRGDCFKNIRPGADRMLHERVLAREVLRVGRAMFGNNLEAELGECVQDRPLERVYHRVIAGLLDFFDELETHLERRDRPGVHHDVVGEHHVVGGKRARLFALARMPLYVLAQVEGVNASIRSHLPTLGELGHNLLFLVDSDQAAEHEFGNTQRNRFIARDRVERGGTAVLAVVEHAAVRAPVGFRCGQRRNGYGHHRAQYRVN